MGRNRLTHRVLAAVAVATGMLLVGCDKGRQPGKLPEGQVQAAQQHRIRMLLKRLESDDEEERAVAVCALSKIGPDAVPALREGADHENELVRKGAHDVLRNKQLIVRVRFDAEVLRLPIYEWSTDGGYSSVTGGTNKLDGVLRKQREDALGQVVIDADELIRWGHVFDLLDQIREAGYQTIRFHGLGDPVFEIDKKPRGIAAKFTPWLDKEFLARPEWPVVQILSRPEQTLPDDAGNSLQYEECRVDGRAVWSGMTHKLRVIFEARCGAAAKGGTKDFGVEIRVGRHIQYGDVRDVLEEIDAAKVSRVRLVTGGHTLVIASASDGLVHLEKPQLFLGGAASGPRVAIVFLIDDHAGSGWASDEMRTSVAGVVSGLTLGESFHIIAATDAQPIEAPASSLVCGAPGYRRRARNFLTAGRRPQWNRTDLARAFSRAFNVHKEANTGARRLIFFLTDRRPHDADGLIEMVRRHRTDDKVQTTVFLLGDHENKTRDLLRRVAEAGGGEFSVTKRKDPRSTTRSTTSPAPRPDRIDRNR